MLSIDDLFANLESKINQKDFCDNVNRCCGDVCGKIERDLDVQAIQFQKEQEKIPRTNVKQ